MSGVVSGESVDIGHITTNDQARDIFTKAFTDPMKWNSLCKLVSVYPQIIVRSHLNSAKALAIIALPFAFIEMAPKQRPMITKYESTWGSGEPDADPWRRSQEQWQRKSSAKADAEENSTIRDSVTFSQLEENRARFSFYSHTLLRTVAYYSGTRDLRSLVASIPYELNQTMMCTVSLLDCAKRAQGVMQGLEELKKDPERFKTSGGPRWNGIKVDVIGDSSLLAHVGPSTPGATMKDGKLVKRQTGQRQLLTSTQK